MTAVIVAAGAFPRKDFPRYLISTADYVVCCDSALETLTRKGIVPAAVVGDMDSVGERTLRGFSGEVVRVSEQESNDLTKAFRFLLGRHVPSDIHILAATGKREDHTLANMSLLLQYRRDLDAAGLNEVNIDMVSDYTMMIPFTSSCELHLGAGREISIFCQDPAQKVHAEGLQWPTDAVVFDAWWKASLNKTSADVVSLRLANSSPVLVVVE